MKLFLLAFWTLSAAANDTIFADGFEEPLVGCEPVVSTADGPRSRLMSTGVVYGAAGQGVRNVLFTEWDNLLGFNDAFRPNPPVPWPGVSGSSPRWTMGRTQYVGLHFTTNDGTPPGRFSYNNYGGSIPISFSISRTCGKWDGEGSCYTLDKQAVDAPIMYWGFDIPAPTYCNLWPNTEYYLNIMFTDKTETRKCPIGQSGCTIAISSTGHQ